jgi:hypothetical protein
LSRLRLKITGFGKNLTASPEHQHKEEGTNLGKYRLHERRLR